MPVALPCSLTQTADGRDLYAQESIVVPTGAPVYFNTVTAPSGGAPGGTVPFNAIYPVYGGGVVPTNGVGLGFPIPAGVYLARLSVPAVGEAQFTKACFTFTWDGTQLTAGAVFSPNNFTLPSCFISTNTNGTTGLANILVWGWQNLVGVNATATIEIVMLQHLPFVLPLV
jgi:hypothetical protein